MIIRNAENYPDLILHVDSNELGDQILSLVYEDMRGIKYNIFTECNQENSHRALNAALKAQMLEIAASRGL